MPLHEVVYYNNVLRLKKAQSAQPRGALHIALDQPQYYLGDIVETEYISAAMPDTCILYKLHLECGKLINLHDFFVAFKAILEERDSIPESEALFVCFLKGVVYC